MFMVLGRGKLWLVLRWEIFIRLEGRADKSAAAGFGGWSTRRVQMPACEAVLYLYTLCEVRQPVCSRTLQERTETMKNESRKSLS